MVGKEETKNGEEGITKEKKQSVRKDKQRRMGRRKKKGGKDNMR
jgi:hypothetical protein